MNAKQELQRRGVLTLAHHDYDKKLNAYAFFKVGNHATGEDLVQDTFIKTWRYLVKGGKIEIMKAFLYHVLNDLIVDEYRKRKPVSLDVLLEKGFEPSADPSRRLFNTLDGEGALLLIKYLPKKYRRVISMRYVQDLSLTEMALLIGQSKNTTAVQVHRGLEKLKLLYNAA